MEFFRPYNKLEFFLPLIQYSMFYLLETPAITIHCIRSVIFYLWHTKVNSLHKFHQFKYLQLIFYRWRSRPLSSLLLIKKLPVSRSQEFYLFKTSKQSIGTFAWIAMTRYVDFYQFYHVKYDAKKRCQKTFSLICFDTLE